MKFSIVPSDGYVYVDSVSLKVDMTDMPSYVRAIQWYGSYGEIEFTPDANGYRLPNLRFNDASPFNFVLERWKESKRKEEERKKLVEEEKMAKLAEYKAREVNLRSERHM